MKKLAFLLTIFIVFLGFGLVACDSENKTQSEQSQDVQKQAYQAAITLAIGQLEASASKFYFNSERVGDKKEVKYDALRHHFSELNNISLKDCPSKFQDAFLEYRDSILDVIHQYESFKGDIDPNIRHKLAQRYDSAITGIEQAVYFYDGEYRFPRSN